MRLDDLPRLTDEERELTDDEYAVMPAAVPAGIPSIEDLIAQRTAALDAMRTAGDDFAAFSRASNQEAELAAQIRRVRQQAVVTNPPPAADLSSPERSRDQTLLDIAADRAAEVDVDKSWRRVLGFLSRLRQRRQQRLLASAQHWLDACQYAAENHPGLYDDIEREAQLAVTKLKEANLQEK